MKKLLLFLLLIPAFANAQDIAYDKQEANGNRSIVTSFVKFAKEKGWTGAEYKIMMDYTGIVNGSSLIKKYYISIPLTLLEREKLSRGRKLLIKFENGNILELANAINVFESDNTYEIIGGMTFYYLHPMYEMSQEQLDSIVKNRVTKLRIETETGKGYFDIDQNSCTKLWNFSGTISKFYNDIQSRLSINNDIHKDF